MPDEEKTFTFKPVTVGDMTYDTIVLREPTVGDMMKISLLRGMEGIVSLVHMISGVPRAAILLLPISVLRQCNAYLEQFTEEPKATEGNDDA